MYKVSDEEKSSQGTERWQSGGFLLHDPQHIVCEILIYSIGIMMIDHVILETFVFSSCGGSGAIL